MAGQRKTTLSYPYREYCILREHLYYLRGAEYINTHHFTDTTPTIIVIFFFRQYQPPPPLPIPHKETIVLYTKIMRSNENICG